ncbi:MAG TPA: FxDxF family PEP-CTERM protein [Sphingobium sp.]|nr:FxDxF family PEP-CTERM protein [Sphingobium sp.]
MKHAALAVSTAIAAFALAPSANASVTLTCPQILGQAVCTFDVIENTGAYGNSFTGAASFDDIFEITLESAGKLSITLTNTLSVGGPISFTTSELIGQGNIAGGAVANDFFVGPGIYQLHFVGATDAKATYAGTIDFAAVPEPATWLTILAGFGALGCAMRRRQNISVSFA